MPYLLRAGEEEDEGEVAGLQLPRPPHQRSPVATEMVASKSLLVGRGMRRQSPGSVTGRSADPCPASLAAVLWQSELSLCRGAFALAVTTSGMSPP